MKNDKKAKAELVEELAAARGRLRELEASAAAAERVISERTEMGATKGAEIGPGILDAVAEP